MTKAKLSPVFLDTSIQIARVVHGPKTKKRIQERLNQHGRVVTGLVCRQEFKRRLLQEADYLLRLLDRYGSFDEVRQHLIRLPGQYLRQGRKKNICLQTLEAVHEATDEERTERAKLYLSSLLICGLRRFDQMVDEVKQDSACGCGRQEVREKAQLRRYEVGETRCGRLKAGACGVVAFLTARADVRGRILAHLRSLGADQKSAELVNAEAFLGRLEKDSTRACAEDPCLKVGDLMIALESAGIDHVYTLNSMESQHLCRALGQTLIVRPVDPLQADIVCDKSTKSWSEFGKRDKRGDQEGAGGGSAGNN